ncbi:hypothetical protein CANARDRAFT_192981 [[Candida] arabinofermentans NRRL YB-2248]|uniref:NADPH--cytochrome P450 reductase n=1 Tax=[Candida] arabinofermentans NRRL YB-2248 TaxID=983967 RepID=A0A1E4T8I9_9ASCO|nr:hypothetical protein CANARDRAFT_192981 [[Candida] arabinofermentans NRRL YB-2248]
MAVDSLDLGVIVAIFLALVAYFTKGSLWGTDSSSSSSASKSRSSRDLIDVLNQNEKKALVLYASQTGTAEDYSHKFSKEFQSIFSIPTMCIDLADYDYDNLNEIFDKVDDFQIMVFFIATYGEGEPTDNSIEFFDYIENECDDLSNVKFSCFSLGNSTYEFYNAMGKKCVDQLLSKNAKLIGENGLGDDGRGTMDEDYLTWKDSLFEIFKNDFNLQEHELSYQPSLKCLESSNQSMTSSVSLGEPNSTYINPSNDLNKFTNGPFDHTHPYLAPIVKTKELFNSKERHCIHAEFDISNCTLSYSTGDHLAIWPSNSNQEVEKLLDILGLTDKKDTIIEIQSLDNTVSLPFPSPTTYETVLRYYLEITGAISRQFLKSIVQFSPSIEIQSKCLELSNDKLKFHELITEQYMNISDLLKYLSNGDGDLKWTNIPFEFIIESIAHLQPRYYSISSSSLSEKDTIHITAVVESEFNEKLNKSINGVTTNLLWNVQLSQNKIQDVKPTVTYNLSGPRDLYKPFKLPIHIRRSTFKLPSNPSIPIIMIGPGTGVAPFRGFIRERTIQVQNGVEIGNNLLFYGSRNSKEDYLYKDEWIDYSKTLGDKFQLITAFSRETSQKVYVQHKLMDMSVEVNDLLNKGAFIYVCGDASRMARDVQQTLIKIIVKERKTTETLATDMIKNLKTLNRYQEDVW